MVPIESNSDTFGTDGSNFPSGVQEVFQFTRLNLNAPNTTEIFSTAFPAGTHWLAAKNRKKPCIPWPLAFLDRSIDNRMLLFNFASFAQSRSPGLSRLWASRARSSAALAP